MLGAFLISSGENNWTVGKTVERISVPKERRVSKLLGAISILGIVLPIVQKLKAQSSNQPPQFKDRVWLKIHQGLLQTVRILIQRGIKTNYQPYLMFV